MRTLNVYPTARAIRHAQNTLAKQNRFIPAMLRMDEFLSRLILVDEMVFIDPILRVLYLKRASDFKAFEHLKFDRALSRFFSNAKALLGFFDELGVEGVGFEALKAGDTYAEYDTHIEILQTLFLRYKEALIQEGFVDRSFLADHYRLNHRFLQNYDQIEIEIEGYLSNFELRLLEEASRHCKLILRYRTSPFTQKMQERFLEHGITLQVCSAHKIDFSQKQLLDVQTYRVSSMIETAWYPHRIGQVSGIFEAIYEMVEQGIAPQNIAVVLPDEAFASVLAMYDHMGNLNFSMGFAYKERSVYKKLYTIWEYLQGKKDHKVLEKVGFQKEPIEPLRNQEESIGDFFDTLEELGLSDTQSGDLRERALQSFAKYRLSFQEWLYLWLKSLESLRIDDIRGGKVTVLGVLETRAVSFEGVIVADFNEGIVPAKPSKDMFLNTAVRRHAGLPTTADREALQKHYYYRLFARAKKVKLFYTKNEEATPSRFLYELGLEEGREQKIDAKMLYAFSKPFAKQSDPIFDFSPSSTLWSAHRLKTFLECKRKYYYRYIEKIEQKPDQTLHEGVLVHDLLKRVFTASRRYEEEHALQKAIDRELALLSEPYGSEGRFYFELLRKKLRRFVREQVAYFQSGFEVTACEKPFTCVIAGLTFKGRIDRIDENDEAVAVIDYKTGSTAGVQKKDPCKVYDFQMNIYSLALSEASKPVTPYFLKPLEGGSLEPIKGMKEKTEILFERLEEMKTMMRVRAERCEDETLCTYCPYRLACERGEYR